MKGIMKVARIGLILTLTVVVFLMAVSVASASVTQTGNSLGQAPVKMPAAVQQYKTGANTNFDQAVPAPTGTPGWVIGLVVAAVAAAGCVVIIIGSRRSRFAQRSAVATPMASGSDREHLKAA